MFRPSIRLPNCQYYCSIAQNADVIGRIPAPRRVLVPASRSRAKLRSRAKACLPLFAAPSRPRGHNTAPRSSTLSVQLERLSGWMRKEEKTCQNANLPQSQQNEGKRKEGKGTMSLTLLCTPYCALADRSLVIPTPAAVQPPTRHNPSRHLYPGKDGNWAAILATSQAGIIYISKH